jgi:hypothetical protein
MPSAAAWAALFLGSVQIFTLAVRASFGSPGAERDFPDMLAVITLE